MSQSSSETYMVGFVICNIVGLQHYSGTINGREMVGLVREPLNRFDKNAIKVINRRSLQVGHIERSVAAVLSPLIDNCTIRVEGIVPNTGRSGNRHKIPIQVHVFARLEMFDTIKSCFSRGELQLISGDDVSFGLSEAMVVKEKKVGKAGKSLDEIFKSLDDKKTKIVAMEPPKEVIKSELFLHQKEGLGWLFQRENSEDLPPFWEEKNTKFFNLLTNYTSDIRPEPLRGGFFADDMGLGKTLTLLSLIALDKCTRFKRSSVGSNSSDLNMVEEISEVEDRLISSSTKKRKIGRVSEKGTGRRKKCKTEDTHVDGNLKGKSVDIFDDSLGNSCKKMTLIVCPPSVFSTWITQLEEHTVPGMLKTYMFYGNNTTTDLEEIKKYDVVLTTYSTLTMDSRSQNHVKNMEWWRVILDEAHAIKNVNSQQSRAVTALKAKRRWVVTGTPIQNSSFDLFSMMAFLNFEPFSIKSYWKTLVQRPIARGCKKGLSRLQALMSTISLRRTKDDGLIELPPKTVETCYVELSVEERNLYDELEGEAKGVVQDYITNGSVLRNYATVLSIILRLRQICTNLALCPSDVRSILPSYNIEADASNNPDLLKKLVAALQDGEDFDCPICISPPTHIVITCCAHIFCQACILKTLKRTKPCCPLCRHPLSQSDLFSPPSEPSDTGMTDGPSSKNVTSSKVSALLTLLLGLRDHKPTTKSVVFSQFQKMLILLEEPLKAAGFKLLRLDGSMNAKKRAQVIEKFQVPGPDGPTVLLASLRASSAGINLTAASRVFLMEPWWNPAVEEQAMDRVHRIGQKEDVKIVRLIARNSIEERILELQERKKKNLAREASGLKNKNQREVSIDDLRFLMAM
ncbi:hypothetical protein Dsin_012046 [Dipteronia sinensis]|uniref:SWI/SNF-related matrix-associated actin-dependent regulator of chromatin subfamily A member 3-like 1 n=1 Tax=Dipteronia sinensis TaxID=43782 RepID=A0AAE0E7N2_9ROSI|nr:hypothetical protein Dsin_012046 [Dipteronia sinensis]